MSNVSISTNKLCIGYHVQGTMHKVQTDLSFALYEGEMICMLGPNGCGKSTLLRTLAGLQAPLEGTYTIHVNSGELSKQVALVLTERLSMENTTVHDVVAMGRYPYTSFLGGLTEDDERIIIESLAQVGLGGKEIAQTPFNAHSDGEKQRILIAKALAQQTPIILLDEPTAHLDLPHRILVLRLLRRLAMEQHKTVLISTHELDLALSLSHRILLLQSPAGEGELPVPYYLDRADNLRATDAFTQAFQMDIFHPLG